MANIIRHKIDLNTWVRKEHFNFFTKFDEPYHSVNIRIDCTRAYKIVKEKGASFWLYYLHKSLAASQEITSWRYRIHGDEVFIYDQINAGTTIPRPNGTFGFGDFKYTPDFAEFAEEANAVIADVQNKTNLEFSGAVNVIRYSALPWIDFTALSHARMFSFRDSCPKISFGKMTDQNGQKTMPISIHIHHALIDGKDLGEFITCYQDLMNSQD